MYADKITDSMEQAIGETERRRAKQLAYNKEHGIDPQPLRKKIADILDDVAELEANTTPVSAAPTRDISSMPSDQVRTLIDELGVQMKEAARELKFELAGRLRDEIADLRKELRALEDTGM